MQLTAGRSYLYIGAVLPESGLLPAVEQIDVLRADGAQIDIKQARQLISVVSGRPFGQIRTLTITNAHLLSELVQNSFLKLFEEPPATLIVLLQAPTAEALLATIRSRLHLVPTQESFQPPSAKIATDRSSLELALSKQTDRSGLVNYLIELRSALVDYLWQPSSRLAADNILLTERSIDRLNANCNQKLTIDAFLLHWRDLSGKEESNA